MSDSKTAATATAEGVLAVAAVALVAVAAPRLPLVLILASVFSIAAVLVATSFVFRVRLLQWLLTPGLPTFNNISLLHYMHHREKGLVAAVNVDVPMPNFRLPAWLKVSIGCVNGPHDLPVISIFGLTSRPGAAATDRSLTVAKKHTEIVLSETVDLFDRALRIRQEAVRLTVYDEAGIAETIAFVLDARSGMSQSAFDAKWGECVLWISLRGSVSICGFSVFKGVLPAYAMNLRDLRGSADQASPTVHVFEGNDIALPSKQLQEQSNSISSDPAVAIERRPPGFSGLFPGIRFDRTGMNNEGLQLTVNCSLSFSYPPAVGLSFHEIEFGVYLNKKMITSGLINPLRIESCRTTNCIFSITFNNPRTLRKGLNLTSLIIDTTGLISRALGFGIGAIETVAFGTMRSVAGVEVSSTVGIKVLAVRGYGPTGEIVELPWLARMLASLEFGEVPVFGEKAGL